MEMGTAIGKVAVVVGVCRGFVGNRVLAARMRQSDDLLLKNAMPQEIDRVIFDFGFPMGPFAMGDLAGLDIGWERDKTPDKDTNIRHQICSRGRLGQKTGGGFYDYKEGSRTPMPNAGKKTSGLLSCLPAFPSLERTAIQPQRKERSSAQ
jgi:3-hydroxyacyl-CoA dehydrogenase